MTGRDRLICDLDERWDGPPPKCISNIKHKKPDHISSI